MSFIVYYTVLLCHLLHSCKQVSYIQCCLAFWCVLNDAVLPHAHCISFDRNTIFISLWSCMDQGKAFEIAKMFLFSRTALNYVPNFGSKLKTSFYIILQITFISADKQSHLVSFSFLIITCSFILFSTWDIGQVYFTLW